MKTIRIFWQPNPESNCEYALLINGTDYGWQTETSRTMSFNQGEHVSVYLYARASGQGDSSPAYMEFDVPVDGGQTSTPQGLAWEVVQ